MRGGGRRDGVTVGCGRERQREGNSVVSVSGCRKKCELGMSSQNIS